MTMTADDGAGVNAPPRDRATTSSGRLQPIPDVPRTTPSVLYAFRVNAPDRPATNRTVYSLS
jgi:hypothetical protein